MFILVHGAYHGGWCWQPLVEQLQALGHQAIAPDLPGHAFTDGWIGQQDLPAYIEAITGALDEAETPPVLVGHSMSGAVVAGAAELRPDKIRKLVFLAAYIPADGENLGELVQSDPDSHAQAVRFDVGGVSAITPKTSAIREAFYNDATERQQAWVEDRIQLQAARVFRAPLSLSAENFGRVAKAAIVCRKDRAISFGHQRRMAERAGCAQIIEMDTGHSPFLTATEALADILIGL